MESALRLFSKLGCLNGLIRERLSRTRQARLALAQPAFSRLLHENNRY
jgi:hypothetical protein